MRSWHLNKNCFSFCPNVSIDSSWSRRSAGKLDVGDRSPYPSQLWRQWLHHHYHAYFRQL